MSKELLRQVTHLTFDRCPDEDLLLLTGLPALKVLTINRRFDRELRHELQKMLPGRQILDAVTGDEVRTVFALKDGKVTVDEEEVSALIPCHYTENDYKKQGEVIVDRAPD